MTDAPLRLHLMRAGHWERFWRRLRAAFVALYRNDGLSIAKGVAYSSLLAFFPAVTTLATLLVQAQADAVSRNIAAFLYEVVPPGSEDIVRELFIVRGQRPNWLLAFATLLAAFAASGAIVSLMQGFDKLYRIPTGRPMVEERVVALALVFGGAVPALGASGLIVFGTRLERMISTSMGNAEVTIWVSILGQLLRYAAAFAAVVLVTAVMYYFGPKCRQHFWRVFPGAVLATTLWLLTTIVFGWYVRNIANYNVLYGSVGAGLALLVWMYVLAVIVLLGCAFNVVRERSLEA